MHSTRSHRQATLVVLLAAAACKSSEAPDRTKREDVPPAPPTGTLGPVTLANLGLVLDVPAGAIVSTEDDMKYRYAHVEVGALKVNVFAVDSSSPASYADVRKVPAGTKLIRDIRDEETADGWIEIKEIERKHDNTRHVEVSVRRTLSAQRWDCGAAVPTEDLARMVLAACQSLRVEGGPPGDWAAGLGGSAPARDAGSEPVASKRRAAAVTPASGTSAIADAVRRNMRPFRMCYERAAAAKPDLAARSPRSTSSATAATSRPSRRVA